MPKISKFENPLSPEEIKSFAPQKYYRVLTEIFAQNKNVFESELTLKQSVLEYFALTEAQKESPTITGLTAYLNISRRDFSRICNSDHKYSSILSRIKSLLVDRAERMLLDGKPSQGLTFWLKNVDEDNWVDKQEINQNVTHTISSVLEQLEKEKEQYVEGEVVTTQTDLAPLTDSLSHP